MDDALMDDIEEEKSYKDHSENAERITLIHKGVITLFYI